MKRYFAYTRVSTVRQGEHGVSLQEQKEAIERYASRKGLEITTWFCEKETAAKTGRPVFNQMLRLVKKGQADGIVIHKIDRSARNLKDWAEIGQLSDSGIDVHFANEAVDLSSPTGMLSADVQAVVAAHYIRNLREEVRKGYYGRLKQGLCPFPCPIGYLDCGEGKVKAIDPIQGPIVKRLFELYATGNYGQRQLTEEMWKLGLRTKKGRKVSINVVARILSNPFYVGELRVRKTNQTFVGAHQPLVSKPLFNKVQQVLSGKCVLRTRSHRFIFSRLIRCGSCGRSLIAESQKGHVYYRCHRHSEILKQQMIEGKFSEVFERLKLLPEEETLIDLMLSKKKEGWQAEAKQWMKTGELQLSSIEQRIGRLTDAYLDGLVDKLEFEQKKTALLLERREAERNLTEMQDGDRFYLARWEKIVELIKTAYPLYKCGFFDERRKIVTDVMSNRLAREKTLDITIRFPFSEIVKRNENSSGGAPRGLSRTWESIFKMVGKHLSELGSAHDFQW